MYLWGFWHRWLLHSGQGLMLSRESHRGRPDGWDSCHSDGLDGILHAVIVVDHDNFLWFIQSWCHFPFASLGLSRGWSCLKGRGEET